MTGTVDESALIAALRTGDDAVSTELIKGIAKFEGRSTIRTWLFAVLVNIAKARAIRERRDAEHAVGVFTGRTVDPVRFRPAGDQLPGGRARRRREGVLLSH
jgi:DNA-directed RNA polymerase specialized sigma24 family protein